MRNDFKQTLEMEREIRKQELEVFKKDKEELLKVMKKDEEIERMKVQELINMERKALEEHK